MVAVKWASAQNPMFRSKFSEDIFNQKYKHEGALTWAELSRTLVDDVCRASLTKEEKDQLFEYIRDMKFIPGGRYLYYAGRKRKFFNNCYVLFALDDTREDWAELSKKVELCLSTGGGLGVNYDKYRASDTILHGTGGVASGPVSKAMMVNEQGRQIMQGGSRRSALYASLNHKHGDIFKFMRAKNWKDMPVGNTGLSLWDIKQQDFNFPAPLDMTNISVNYDTEWLMSFWKTGDVGPVFKENAKQAVTTGEPGFSFNFFNKEKDIGRNACTELCSEDDSDICNLGSVNMSRIASIDEMKSVVELATKFLVCGTLVADVPYQKIADIRAKNRRVGLGLMGIHEWLIQRKSKYEVTEELHRWLRIYKGVSNDAANKLADQLSISRPLAKRAIAPTGTIGILAGTSTGIEPIFSVAYKRRFLKGTKWHYQFVVDGAAQELAKLYDVDPDTFDSALSLAEDYERRIKFQADVQDYVDMAISSTINLPEYGSDKNNDSTLPKFIDVLAKYAPRLRGFTAYPDGSRGGQPLTPVAYKDALAKLGETFEESVTMHDVCDITGRGGSCGV